MSFDFGNFYLQRKQYLEKLKKSKQNSNDLVKNLVKRTIDLLVYESESGLVDLIESNNPKSPIQDKSTVEERYKSFLDKYDEEKKKEKNN